MYTLLDLFILNLFSAALGLHCCMQAFSSCRERGLPSSCGPQASHCGDFSYCGAQALVVVAQGLTSCGSRTAGFSSYGRWAQELRLASSEHRLNSCGHGHCCSVACGIFLDQGLNPCPLHWQVNSQSLCHPGSPFIRFLSGKCKGKYKLNKRLDSLC